eukprot:XP_016656397.1 PREDICTED: uncharacterized protein LOC100574477 [Acyrthosiphon pisum]
MKLLKDFTRFQKIKKKVMKNDFKKIEKLKWNTNSLDSPASSIDEEDDDSDKDPNYSNTVIHEENIVLETPPSEQKLILKDLPKTFPGTSLFKRKLNFDTNKCKSLSPKSKMCNVINFNEVEKIITTSSSPFKVTDNNISSNSTPHSNNDILTKINGTKLNTWYEIKALVERIESLENSLLNKGSKEVLNDDSDNNFIFALPLSNEDELEIFEEKLLDTVFKKKLISELSRLVRGTLPSTVRAIMRYMFKDILLEQYSFKGQKKKKVFHTLKSCSVIFDSIKKINEFQNFNSIDEKQPIKIFIAGAKFRNKPESSEF